MLIQEALKANKPFRRPHWEAWGDKDELTCFIYSKEGAIMSIGIDDLLADDWIVEDYSLLKQKIKERRDKYVNEKMGR